jgi:hypothetical protein
MNNKLLTTIFIFIFGFTALSAAEISSYQYNLVKEIKLNSSSIVQKAITKALNDDIITYKEYFSIQSIQVENLKNNTINSLKRPINS